MGENGGSIGWLFLTACKEGREDGRRKAVRNMIRNTRYIEYRRNVEYNVVGRHYSNIAFLWKMRGSKVILESMRAVRKAYCPLFYFRRMHELQQVCFCREGKDRK